MLVQFRKLCRPPPSWQKTFSLHFIGKVGQIGVIYFRRAKLENSKKKGLVSLEYLRECILVAKSWD